MKFIFKLKLDMTFGFNKSITLPKTESSNVNEQVDGYKKRRLMTIFLASIALVKLLTIVLKIFYIWLTI